MQVTLNTRVPIEIAKALDDYAKSSGKSKAAIVAEAIQNYLKEVSPMENHIQLVEQIGTFKELEVWTAICHHDGYETGGFALTKSDDPTGTVDTAFYDSDPRDMDESDLSGGWTLPAYWPK